jgi:hypothetical protein
MENTLTPQEKKKLYVAKNKERIALYARSYYHKRCEQNENYKKILCENVKKNKKIIEIKYNIQPDNIIPQNLEIIPKKRGRPIKYK